MMEDMRRRTLKMTKKFFRDAHNNEKESIVAQASLIVIM